MNHLTTDQPVRYCGRLFTAEEMAHIRRLLVSEPNLNRAQLSRRVCSDLRWLRGNGRSKEMSCRVAMLRMERDGLITLPPPLKSNGNGRHRPRPTSASDPRAPAVAFGRRDRPTGSSSRGHAAGLGPVERTDPALSLPGLQATARCSDPLPGLRRRALAGCPWLRCGRVEVAPRDEFIGWTADQRRAGLHRIVNNARFLILPWVTVRNLASRILAAVAKRLPRDWDTRAASR